LQTEKLKKRKCYLSIHLNREKPSWIDSFLGDLIFLFIWCMFPIGNRNLDNFETWFLFG
jgi:hypothetical protein